MEIRVSLFRPLNRRKPHLDAARVHPMRQTPISVSFSELLVRLIRHFGDFVTLPIAIVIFVGIAGVHRLYLVLLGVAAWTLLEYLVHRFLFHRYSVGRRLHQPHHDHPSDPDAERSSFSTPLIAFPIGFLLIVAAGMEGGSAILLLDLLSTGVGGFPFASCCRTPPADRAKLLALFSEEATPNASSSRKL